MCVVDIDRMFDFFCLLSVSGLIYRVKIACAASMSISSPILSVLLTEDVC